jgi:hypothetical protein
MAMTIDDLPENILRRALLTVSPPEDLIAHVSRCARVSAKWRRLLETTAAYGRTIGIAAVEHGRAEPIMEGEPMPPVVRGQEMEERARVLKLLSNAMQVSLGYRCAKCLFGAIFIRKRSFYQDRLRTNIGEAQKRRMRFVLQRMDGRGPCRGPDETCPVELLNR